MEPQPSQTDPVDTKFKRPELVSRLREPTPPAGGQRGCWGSQRSAGGGPTGAPLTLQRRLRVSASTDSAELRVLRARVLMC